MHKAESTELEALQQLIRPKEVLSELNGYARLIFGGSATVAALFSLGSSTGLGPTTGGGTAVAAGSIAALGIALGLAIWSLAPQASKKEISGSNLEQLHEAVLQLIDSKYLRIKAAAVVFVVSLVTMALVPLANRSTLTAAPARGGPRLSASYTLSSANALNVHLVGEGLDAGQSVEVRLEKAEGDAGPCAGVNWAIARGDADADGGLRLELSASCLPGALFRISACNSENPPKWVPLVIRTREVDCPAGPAQK